MRSIQRRASGHSAPLKQSGEWGKLRSSIPDPRPRTELSGYTDEASGPSSPAYARLARLRRTARIRDGPASASKNSSRDDARTLGGARRDLLIWVHRDRLRLCAFPLSRRPARRRRNTGAARAASLVEHRIRAASGFRIPDGAVRQ